MTFCFCFPFSKKRCIYLMRWILDYRLYTNKRWGPYLIFRATSAALIRGQPLFENCTRQIYFFYIFIQWYTFYLLIFLWTDTKLIVNLELQEKFMRWKKPDSFMIMRAKISAVRANSFVVVEQFTTFSQFCCHCLLYQNLRAPAWEGKPLPHLNLCTGKDLHWIPSRFPIASEAYLSLCCMAALLWNNEWCRHLSHPQGGSRHSLWRNIW